MSAQDLQRLTSNLEHDPALATRFAELDRSPTAWADEARAHGYTLTPQEAVTLMLGHDGLGDEDLEQAAGGWSGGEPPPPGGGGGG